MSIFNSFKSVTVFSAVLSVFCATVGIIFSILAATPVGPTIVVANIIVYIVCRLISGMIRRA
jgi:zinc transport system permease protein